MRAHRGVLNMESSERPEHVAQEGSAYSGRSEPVCCRPLFLVNDHGDCLGATLRRGNVRGAEDRGYLLVPKNARQDAAGKRGAFCAGAAFAKPEVYPALEESAVAYAIRMPAKKSLELAEDLLFGPLGRPSRKSLSGATGVFQYQAESWTKPRRIVAKKEGKQATHWTRLSCRRFRANEVRLQLSVLADNLGNLWRRVSLPQRIKTWSLPSLPAAAREDP